MHTADLETQVTEGAGHTTLKRGTLAVEKTTEVALTFPTPPLKQVVELSWRGALLVPDGAAGCLKTQEQGRNCANREAEVPFLDLQDSCCYHQITPTFQPCPHFLMNAPVLPIK